MGKLLSCPFCRELFSEGEGSTCPECGLPLVPLSRLPLSLDGQEEAIARGELLAPEDQKLPFHFGGRGRGALLFLALAGLSSFFVPWVSLERPDAIALSGYDLARSSAPWLWGGAVAWFTMLPLLASRRSINQLRGIRIIATFFAMITVGEVILMLSNPPDEHLFFSSGLQYNWGIYLSGLVAALASLVALRLGGSDTDFRDLPVLTEVDSSQRGSSLH